MQNRSSTTSISKSHLVYLSDDIRHIFAVIFTILTIVSLIGNCATIYTIGKRNYRCIQKTCIISLALSDILGTAAVFAINIVNFIFDMKIWPLGSFLCAFLPMCQMTGILASSTALMFIAMDRYRNVVHALSKRWNPRLSFCLIAAIIVWLISFGVSYPLYDIFVQREISVLLNNVTNETMDAFVCVTFQKDKLAVYYISTVSIIFFPILFVFFWFYYNIAALVWKHRKPLSTIFNKKKDKSNFETSRDIRVERKIRTFKIIITLMMVFIICRLPYYMALIVKKYAYGEEVWYMNYSFLALHILNCCLNPLLYTFLHVTLKFCVKIKTETEKFVCEICCFCCSKVDFEEYEKENPFVVANQKFDVENSKRNSRVKFDDKVKY
ncbi:7tm 1 domain containing protein [Asbolus verrucosus]|uniref:7tm 1 domain containing protein n=1 Tax=Asbolus verrucosus TaxID=1661398 RepID=A0A482V998_ASBVE|nr:7tm 1 domain containing protein [Asbolus verrucosus]